MVRLTYSWLLWRRTTRIWNKTSQVALIYMNCWFNWSATNSKIKRLVSKRLLSLGRRRMEKLTFKLNWKQDLNQFQNQIQSRTFWLVLETFFVTFQSFNLTTKLSTIKVHVNQLCTRFYSWNIRVFWSWQMIMKTKQKPKLSQTTVCSTPKLKLIWAPTWNFRLLFLNWNLICITSQLKLERVS